MVVRDGAYIAKRELKYTSQDRNLISFVRVKLENSKQKMGPLLVIIKNSPAAYNPCGNAHIYQIYS